MEQLSTAGDGLNVYRLDVLFRRQHRWVQQRPIRNSFIIFGAYLGVALGAKAFTAMVHGDLGLGEITSMFRIDQHRFPPFQWVFGYRRTPDLSPTALPLLRDYADLAATILVAAHTAFLHIQWDQLSGFARDLGSARLLKIADDDGQIRDFEAESDQLVNQVGWGYVAPALTALMLAGFLVLDTFRNHGLYASLADDRGKVWELAAFHHWWANPTTNPPGFAVELFFLAVTFYFVLRHNWIGWCALRRLRALVPLRTNESAFTLLNPEFDSDQALRVMRGVLTGVSVSTLLLLPAIFFLFLALPSGGFQETMIIFTALLAVASPLYLLLPLSQFNRHLRLARSEALNALRLKAVEARKTNDVLSLVEVAISQQRVDRVPDQLVATRQLLGFVVVYLIPLVLFIDWVLRGAS